MESGFFAIDAVPFAPGESPYRIKGVVYNDLFAYLDEQIPGGRAVVLNRLKASKLEPFFAQPFVSIGWYDIFPLVALQKAAAHTLETPHLDLVRSFARWTFPRQVYGVYKFLLKLTTPDTMVRSLGRAVAQFYDFVRVDVEQVRPKMYVSRGANIPDMLAPPYMASSEVALLILLDIAGAKGVRHRWLPPTDDGEQGGVRLVTVTREISWEK